MKNFFNKLRFKKSIRRDPIKTLESLFFKRDIFDSEYYLIKYADVRESGIDPYRHYIKYGFYENRRPCSEGSITNLINKIIDDQVYDQRVIAHKTSKPREKNLKISAAFHSKGNFFFQEIASHIVRAAKQAGYEANLISEKELRKVRGKKNFLIVVAPQEFFFLGRNEKLHNLIIEKIPNVAYYLAEQPQTNFFFSQVKYLFDNAQIIDMNFQTAIFLQSLGFDCQYLPLGFYKADNEEVVNEYSANLDGIYIPGRFLDFKEFLQSRPVDVSFIGNGCERRQKFFNKKAEFFSQYNSFIFMPDWKTPHTEGGLATLNKNDSLALCQRTKIFLNIHRDDFNYFEWHRICLRGFVTGALVLTEPVYKVPEFEPGIHYIECLAEEMPDKIQWLLDTDEGNKEMARVAQAGQEAYMQTSMSKDLQHYFGYLSEKGLLH